MDRTRLEQIEAEAARWLARQHSGSWSEHDAAQLGAWLHASTSHRIEYLRIQNTWKASGRLKALGAGISPGTVPQPGSWGDAKYLDGEPAQPTAVAASRFTLPNVRARHPVAAMAAVLLLAAIAVGVWQAQRHEFSTAVGAVDTVSLDDGSQVTLNTASSIQVAIDERRRHVDLKQGEAFFQVAKDPDRPFTVTVGDQTITAIGTAFSARRLEDDVRVTVTEGQVRLDGPGVETGQVLTAGATAMATRKHLIVKTVPAAEADKVLSWRLGYINFDNVPLEQAVAEFNRYTRETIVIEDPELAPMRVGGNFRVGNTPAFIWMLENGFPIEARTSNHRISLRHR